MAAMSAINWGHLGFLQGEYLESFAATCLCTRYRDARKTRPASGDGGVDVLRETPDGIYVWQIKQYTAPLTSRQEDSVADSWRTFWREHVEAGRKILGYELVTPWTPTESKYATFRNLVADATFPTRWSGAVFFDELAASYPWIFDRFTKGEQVLESMVNAKSMIASSPVETSDSYSMISAIQKRESALQDLRDMASDHYYIDPRILTLPPGQEFDYSTLTGGMYYRIERLAESRWKIESLVPKTSQSLEDDPITMQTTITVEKGSEAEQAFEDFRYWGKPVSDLPAIFQTTGGPFAEPDPGESLVSFEKGLFAPGPHPDLLWLHPELPDQPLLLTVSEVTHGPVGGGVRVVASSASGVLTFEIRTSSTEADDSFALTIDADGGQDAELVATDLRSFQELWTRPGTGLKVASESSLGQLGAAEVPTVVPFLRQISEDLTVLQAYASVRLPMPDLDKLGDGGLSTIHNLARIYAGEEIETTWEEATLVVADPEVIRAAGAKGCAMHLESIVLSYDGAKYPLNRPVAHLLFSPTILSTRTHELGTEVVVVPGDDARHVMARWDQEVPDSNP